MQNSHLNFDPQNDDLCDCCGSSSLVSTPEGFLVCRACGVEQKFLSMVNTEPFSKNKDRHQFQQSHAVLFSTSSRTPGTKFERVGTKLDGVYRRTRFETHEVHALRAGFFEIRRICDVLGLSVSFNRATYQLFKKAWVNALKGSKSRNVHLLAVVCAIHSAVLHGIVIPRSELGKILDGKNYDFGDIKTVMLQARRNLPKIRVEHKIRLIKAFIDYLAAKIREGGKMAASQYKTFSRYLNVLRREILGRVLIPSKTPVIAASIVSAALLIAFEEKVLPLSKIAKYAGIVPSAIQVYLSRVIERNYGRKISKGIFRSRHQVKEIFANVFVEANLEAKPMFTTRIYPDSDFSPEEYTA